MEEVLELFITVWHTTITPLSYQARSVLSTSKKSLYIVNLYFLLSSPPGGRQIQEDRAKEKLKVEVLPTHHR